MLLQLQELKREVQSKYYRLQETRSLYAQSKGQFAPDLFFSEEAEIEFLMFSANSMLEQIHATGVEVKDVDTGLCDFRALMHGSEVYLCWRLGEPEVLHWHGLSEGVVGRKPIIDEVDFEWD
jgi:hypothetical protein